MKPRNNREPHDLYRTKPEVAYFLCKKVVGRLMYQWHGVTPDGLILTKSPHPKPPKRLDVLEVGCYDGPFLKGIDAYWPEKRDATFVGLDIVEKHKDFDDDLAEYLRADYTNLTEKQRELILDSHLIIGNPPFSLLEEFLTVSRDLIHADGEIVFICQIGFLGSANRYELFREIKPWSIEMLRPRPGFIREGKKNGSDAREYVMVTWKSYNSIRPTQFNWLDWKQCTELKQPYQGSPV